MHKNDSTEIAAHEAMIGNIVREHDAIEFLNHCGVLMKRRLRPVRSDSNVRIFARMAGETTPKVLAIIRCESAYALSTRTLPVLFSEPITESLE